jgi:hypothetical protein
MPTIVMPVKIKEPLEAGAQQLKNTLTVTLPEFFSTDPFTVAIEPSANFTWEAGASTIRSINDLRQFITDLEYQDRGDYDEPTGILLQEPLADQESISITCNNKEALKYLFLVLGQYSVDTTPVWQAYSQINPPKAAPTEAAQIAEIEALMGNEGGGGGAGQQPSAVQLLTTTGAFKHRGLSKKDPRRQTFPQDHLHETKGDDHRPLERTTSAPAQITHLI